jgi:2,4-dienoyl-CoA reductase-like NADH-dependent reductase (Old Yellow Enzyme family)
MSSLLSESVRLRELSFPNRIGMAPMCQYSALDGKPTSWHKLHYATRAVGGVGLIILEATAVEAIGRITARDLGLWDDSQIEPLKQIVDAITEHGSVAGIQLAHAGRKASTIPFGPGLPLAVADGGWQPVAPSSIAWDAAYPIPAELTLAEIKELQNSFVAAATRADKAGFQLLELHAAHGYLLHSFLSPVTNIRTDAYGGDFAGRAKMLLEITTAVRAVWPEDKPLAVRLSTTDWVEGGWTVDDSVKLAKELKIEGVDLIDCSTGGIKPDVNYPAAPGWQVPMASRIKKEAGIAVAAVGLVTDPQQAEAIINDFEIDIVLLGRELLSNPYWPYKAAIELKGDLQKVVPKQYIRAIPTDLL